MSVTVFVTQARSSLPGGRPWVELPRFLVKSFQFNLDIHFLHSRWMRVGNVPRFDSLDRVYKRLFQNAPADGPQHEAERAPFEVLALANDGDVDVRRAIGVAREIISVAGSASPQVGV